MKQLFLTAGISILLGTAACNPESSGNEGDQRQDKHSPDVANQPQNNTGQDTAIDSRYNEDDVHSPDR